MSVAHKRAARREREAATALGTERVRHRPRYVSAPDTLPVRLPSGDVLQPEVKTRKRLPRLIVDALTQAMRYQADAIPVAVISETGGHAIACLPLEDLARLLGLQPQRLVQLPLLGCA